MPLHRNFTYWIDKRLWKYYFLMLSLALQKIVNNQLHIQHTGFLFLTPIQ